MYFDTLEESDGEPAEILPLARLIFEAEKVYVRVDRDTIVVLKSFRCQDIFSRQDWDAAFVHVLDCMQLDANRFTMLDRPVTHNSDATRQLAYQNL